MNNKISSRVENIQCTDRVNSFHFRIKTLLWIILITTLSLYGCTGATPCNDEGREYRCSGSANHTITLSGVPEGVVPHLLPVSPEREQQLLEADRQGTGCIISVVGDLVFMDQYQEPVTDFEDPITISYEFTESDVVSFESCKTALFANGIVPSPEDVDYLPVAFFDNKVWMPIGEYGFVEDRTVTFEITSWGDQPVGWGTEP